MLADRPDARRFPLSAGPTSVVVALAIAVLAGAGCDETPSSDRTGDEPARETREGADRTSTADSAAPSTDARGSNAVELDRSRYYSLVDLVDLQRRGALSELETVTVSVDEGPAYESSKQFRGWTLDDLLDAHADLPDDPSGSVVQFIATDGYRATVPLDALPTAEGVVAFRDVDAPEGADWRPFPKGDRTTTPAPFYLVWPSSDPSKTHRPWAYKLAAIGIAEREALWGDAVPSHDDSLRDGFAVFREHCMKCHAVNRSGGSVGPELNVPMNVTEYWDVSHLRRYIRHPDAYRAGAEMPSMDSELSDDEMEALIAYLRGMRTSKVCDSAGACRDLHRDRK